MRKRTIRLTAVSFLLLCTWACAPLQRASRTADAVAPAPALLSESDPLDAADPQPVPHVASETAGDQAPAAVPLGVAAPALTETLDRTLDELAAAQEETETLLVTVRDLEEAAAQKDRKIEELAAGLLACDTTIAELEAALKGWQLDVIGFRDELRDYEEAEIEVLQEMARLLRGLAAPEQSG